MILSCGRGVAAACLFALVTPAAVGAQLYEVRDSAGVQIIVSGPEDSDALGPWSLSDTPLLSIGALDGAEPYLFTQVWDALRTPDGRLAVVEATSYEIRIFDSHGRHEVSFGGRGGGPREFGGPPWIELSGPDTLVVWDPGHYRLSRYSLTGELLDEITIRTTVMDLGIIPFPNGLVWATSSGGTLLWTGPDHTGRRMEEGLGDLWRRLIRIAPGSGSHTDFGRHPSGQIYSVRGPAGGFRGIPNVFGPTTFGTFGAGDRVWISDPARYEVRLYEADGGLARILRGQRTRMPVRGEMVAAARDELPRMSEGLGISLRTVEAAFREIPVPDSVPAIGALLHGAADRLWVGRRHGQSWTARPVSDYDVFAPDGRWLSSVRLPDDARRLLEAGEDYVLVSAQDEFDVQYVRLYQVVRGR